MSNTATALIEVRIRREDEGRATHLCYWPVTDLDSLLPTLNRWGLMVDGDDVSGNVGGQFTYEDGEAYFELLITDNEE